MEKSLLEIAFEFVNNSTDGVSFTDLWNYVKEEAKLSEEEAAKKVSRFYTNLILDGRFVTLGENKWDLRSRHDYETVHIDMKDVYSDVDTVDNDNEDTEDKEYNEALEDPKDDDDEDSDIEPEESTDNF